jgi:ADP-ribose pyrophosphatase YjhB (NUDIX family)
LDGNETVIAAARREAREEVAVQIEPEDIHYSSVMHRLEGDERVDFFVNVLKWNGEPINAEPDKCDELLWTDVNNLPQNTIPYIKRALHNHWNEIKFDEYGWQRNRP